MTKAYLEHLLAFSGGVFADARLKLMQGLSDEELSVLIQDGVKRCTTRKARERLSVGILNLINAEERATSELPVPHTSPRQSALPTLAKVAQVSSTSIPGMASQKRKAEDPGVDDNRVPKAATPNVGNRTLSDRILEDTEDTDDEDLKFTGGPGSRRGRSGYKKRT